MIGLSRELAAGIFLFQALQAMVAGVMIALLLWLEKSLGAGRQLRTGDRS